MGFWDDVWGRIKDAGTEVVEAVSDLGSNAIPGQPQEQLNAVLRPTFTGSFDWGKINPGFKEGVDPRKREQWLTGGDQNSQVNSWDNDFLKRMYDQYDSLLASGEALDQFDRDDATGVVLADYVGKTGVTHRFGDVYDNGKFQGNMFEQGGDERLAGLMMAQLTLEKEELAQIGQSRNPEASLAESLERFRAEASETYAAGIKASEQQDRVDETQAELAAKFDGRGDELAAGGLGVLGGVGVGAGVGSIFGPVGTVIGAGVGGVIGGFGGWLNRDDLTEQMASAYEISKIAFDEDFAAGMVTSLKQFSGVAGAALNPFTNVVKGAMDEDRGDGVGLYQQDEVPGWAKPLDIAAHIVDAGVTFASPVGVGLFMTQMGGYSLGGVGELTVGRGMQWDPQTASYRNVYTDASTHAWAAWGATGIDAAQMVMGKGMYAKLSRSSEKKLTTLDNMVIKRAGLEGKAVEAETLGAMRFFKDEAGEVIGHRLTAAAAIPSDGLAALSAVGMARVTGASTIGRGRVIKKGDMEAFPKRMLSSDVYKTARDLANQENVFKSALVNAFGEGTEEGVQELLESWSFGHLATLQEIGESYMYGMAMGMGMSVGGSLATGAKNNRAFNYAKIGYQRLEGKELTREEFDRMRKDDPEMLRKYMRNAGDKEQQNFLNKITKNTYMQRAASSGKSGYAVTTAAQAMLDAEQQRKFDKSGVASQEAVRITPKAALVPLEARDEFGTINPDTPGFEQATAADVSEYSHDSIIDSLKTSLAVQSAHNENWLRIQEDLTQQIKERTEAGGDVTHLQSQLDDVTHMVELTEGPMQAELEWLLEQMEAFKAAVDNEVMTEDNKFAATARINRILDAAFRGTKMVAAPGGGFTQLQQNNEVLRRAASVLFARSPNSSTGSKAIHGMAVSWRDVKEGTRGGGMVPLMSQAAQESDFDGDRATFMVAEMLSQRQFDNYSIGLHLITSNESGFSGMKIDSTDNDSGMGRELNRMYHNFAGDNSRAYVVGMLNNFTLRLQARYQLTDNQRALFEDALTQVLFNAAPRSDTPMQIEAGRMAARVREFMAGKKGANPAADPKSDLGKDYAEAAEEAHRDPMQAMIATLMTDSILQKRIPERAVRRRRNEAYELVDLFRASMQDALTQMGNEVAHEEGEFKVDVEGENRPRRPLAARQVEHIKVVKQPYAATLMQTVVLMLRPNSLLRLAGVGNNTAGKTKDVEAFKNADKNEIIDAMNARLRMLADSTMVRPGEDKLDTFDVSGRAMAMLRSMAHSDPDVNSDNLDAAVFLLANEHVPARGGHGTVSVAQMVVNSILDDIELNAAEVLQRDPDQARSIKMLRISANDAREADGNKRTKGELRMVMEVISGLVPLNIISKGGVDLSPIDIEGTIGQGARKLVSMDPHLRNSLENSLRNSEGYLNDPITRELLDTLFNFANTRISYNEEGEMYGEVVDNNDRGSKAFAGIREKLSEALDAYPRFPGEPKDVRLFNMLEENVNLAAALYEALMADVGMAGFVFEENNVPQLPQWVVDALVMEDHAKAEMVMWQGRFQASMREYESQIQAYGKDKAKTSDTLVTLVTQISNMGDPVLYGRVMNEFYKEGMTRERFEEFVAREVPMKTAPVLMYENKLDLFEPSLASGGWGSGSTTLRGEIQNVAMRFETLPTIVREARDRRESNVSVAKQVRQQLREGNLPEEQRLRLERVLKQAGSRPMTLLPENIVQMLVGLQGFSADSWTKGTTMEHLRAVAHAAMKNNLELGFVSPDVEILNRMVGTVNIRDVLDKPFLIFTAMEIRDDHGRIIDMGALRDSNGEITMESLLLAIEDDALSDLIMEAILPKSLAHNPTTDQMTETFTGPTTLQELLYDNHEFTAFEADSASSTGYTKEADLQFAMEMSARMQRENPDMVEPFGDMVLKLAQAKMTSAEGQLTPGQLAAIAVDTWIEVSALIRDFAVYLNTGEGSLTEDVSEEYLNLNEAARARMGEFESFMLNMKRILRGDMIDALASRQENIGKSKLDLAADIYSSNWEREGLADILRTSISRANSIRLSEYQQQAFELVQSGKFHDPNYASEVHGIGRQIRALARAEGQEDSFGNMLVDYTFAAADNDKLGQLRAMYYVPKTDPTADVQRTATIAYLEQHPEIEGQIRDDGTRMLFTYIRQELSSETARGWEPSDAEWELLSRVTISHILQNATIPEGDTGDELVIVGENDWALFDPTFVSLLDPLTDPTSGMLKHARDMAREAGVGYSVTGTELMERAKKLFNPEKMKKWTPIYASQARILSDAIPSAAAGMAIPRDGNLSKEMNSLAVASKRSFGEPDAQYLQEIQVTRTNDGLVFSDPDFEESMLAGAFGEIYNSKGNLDMSSGIRVNGLNTKYRAISLVNLENGMRLGETYTVKYFAENNRPPGAEWMNNIFFDGIISHSVGMVSLEESLIAEMIFGEDGVNNLLQRADLDAVKKRKNPAFKVNTKAFVKPDLTADPDISKWLRLQAREFITTKIGQSTLGMNYFKAALKAVKMRYLIQVGEDLISPDEYMSIVNQGGDALANMLAQGPKIISLDNRTAATWYGEVHTRGINQGEVIADNLGHSGAYDPDLAAERQAALRRNLVDTVPVGATRLAIRDPLRRANLSTNKTVMEAAAGVDAYAAVTQQRDGVMAERARLANDNVIDPARSRKNATKFSRMRMEEDGFIEDVTAEILGTQREADSEKAFAGGEGTRDFSYGMTVVAKDPTASLLDGQLTLDNYTKLSTASSRPGSHGLLTYGDFAVFDLNTFEKENLEDNIYKVLDYMISANVEIQLTGGSPNYQFQVAQYIRKRQYEPVRGKRNVYTPAVSVAMTTLERAVHARARSIAAVSARTRAWTLNVYPGQPFLSGIGDNHSFAANLDQPVVIDNMTIMVGASENRFGIEAQSRPIVHNLLESLTDEEWAAAFAQSHEKDQRTLKDDPSEAHIMGVGYMSDIEARLDLMERQKTDKLSFSDKGLHLKGEGQFSVHVVRFPQAGAAGEKQVLYLHRAGAKWMKDEDIVRLAKADPNRKIIIGTTESDVNQTTYKGEVLAADYIRSNGGMRVKLRTTLGEVYNKLVSGSDPSAMKHILTQLPDEMRYMFSNMFPDDSAGQIGVITNMADTTSKTGLYGAIINYQSAATMLGIDNMPLFFKGLYGTEYDESSANDRARMKLLREMLSSIRGTRHQTDVTRDMEGYRFHTLRKGLDELDFFSRIDDDMTNWVMQALDSDGSTAPTKALLAAMTYLTMSGTTLQDIEGASGLTTIDTHAYDKASNTIPNVFARVFDSDQALRAWAIDQFQARFSHNGNEGWKLDQNYDLIRTLQVRNPDGSIKMKDGKPVMGRIRAVLSMPSYASIGEPTESSADPRKPAVISSHEVRFSESIGSQWATKYDREAFQLYLDTMRNPITESSLFDTYHTEFKVQTGKHPWAMQETLRNRRKRLAHRKLAQYFHRIDFRNMHPEPEFESRIKEIERQVTEIADQLFDNNGRKAEHYVHWMIRMRLAQPEVGKSGEINVISLEHIEKSLSATKQAIEHGLSPLKRGLIDMVPLEIANAIYKSQAKRPEEARYQPYMYTIEKRNGRQRAESFDDYVYAFINHSLNDTGKYHDDIVDLTLDGIIYQYQSGMTDGLNAPLSISVMKDLKLLSQNDRYAKAIERAMEKNDTLAEFLARDPGAAFVSINPMHEVLLTPVEMSRLPDFAPLQRLLGDDIFMDLDDTMEVSDEIRTAALTRWNNWRRKNDISFPVKQSLQVHQDNGTQREDNVPKSNALVRTFLGIRHALAMLNPALPIAALVEATQARVIHGTRKTLYGESTGMIGSRVIRMMNWAISQDNGVGVLARGIGWMPLYVNDQIRLKNNLVNNSANVSALRDIVHESLGDFVDDLMYQGVPSLVKQASKLGNLMQDLARGTRSKTLMNTYIDAFIAEAVNTGVMPMDHLLRLMSNNAAAIVVQPEFAAAHNAGIQAMSDLRNTQQTVLNKMVEGIYKPLTVSGNAGVNTIGNMMFAIPLMFSKYAANFALSVTGLRGVDMLTAHALRGRQKPTDFFAMLRAKSQGQENWDMDTMDMDDVIGGLDAADAVINMGITHVQLFMAGAILQGLGLSGEDEEERRRRRAAQAQGVALLKDPREIENDFRNAHALFLDFLPGPLKQFFMEDGSERPIADVHWTLKQIFMPMLGMERYFETGDIRQLWWGFTEAIGSMPLINTMMFDRTLNMASELTQAAGDSAAAGGPNALPDTMGFMTALVSYFENALFESSFVNSIYVGMDDYDRDPYIIPMRDSDGKLQRDIEGNVRAMQDGHMSSKGLDGRGIGLTTYVDDEGNVKQGYARPRNAETQMRQLAENRASFALISSLFSMAGGKGSMLRYNMPVKTHKVEKNELSIDEQKAVVLGALNINGGLQNMFEAAQGGSQEDQAAAALTMSFIDPLGNEILTKDGAEAVFRGIVKGSVGAGSEALYGTYVDFETRKLIQAEWLEELTQEAVNHGLSESVAKTLAKKAWYGPDDGSAPGIHQILWDKNIIPYGRTQEYQQLNTTYVRGPDGKMWATGFTRPKLLGALGLTPLMRLYNSADTGIGQDSRGNTADDLLGVNTGMRGLVRVDDSWDIPTDVEIGDAIVKAIEDLDGKSFTPFSNRRRGGGGGGGYAPRPTIPYGQVPRLQAVRSSVPMISAPRHNAIRPSGTSNPLLRRDSIHRQKFTSDRGRLKPWQ